MFMRTMLRTGRGLWWLPLVLLAACGGDGGSGGGSNDGNLAVTLTIPADGATVSGTAVAVRATVSGASRQYVPTTSGALTFAPEAVRAATVRFLVDDTSVFTDDADPYFFEWNSTTVANGRHDLRAVATDGDRSASDEVSIIVNNEGGGIAVVVDPPSVQLSANQSRQFTAQVLGSTDQGVTWAVDGGAGNGTVTANGLYTAPANVAGLTSATVRATSTVSPGVSGTASVVFQGGGGIRISIDPPSVSLQVGTTQQFTATVTGTTNLAVNWVVVGGAQNGTVTSGGLYTAPATVPVPATVTVRGTAAADPSATATAAVTITAGSPIPKDELELLADTYTAGFDVLSFIEGTNQLVFQSIFFASATNGNQPTITGTITEGPGANQFSWAPTPADRLILQLNQGSYTVSIDPETIDGDFGNLEFSDWESFDLTHIIEYAIQGPLGNLSIRSAKIPRDDVVKDVQQIAQGTLVVDGTTWQVNTAINGVRTFFITVGEFSSSRTTWDLTMSGTFQSGTQSVTVDHRQTFEDDFSTGPSGSVNIIEQDNAIANTGTNGSVTFAFSDVFYNWDDTGNTNPVYEAGGTILRDGTPFANFGLINTSGAVGMQLLGNGAIIPF